MPYRNKKTGEIIEDSEMEELLRSGRAKSIGSPTEPGAEAQEEGPGFVSRAGQAYKSQIERTSEALAGEGEFEGASTARRATGATAGAFSAIPAAGVAALPGFLRRGLEFVGRKLITDPATEISETPALKKLAEWAETHPEGARFLDEALGTTANVGEIAGDILLAAGGKKVTQGTAGTAKSAGGAVVRGGKKVVQPIRQGAREVTRPIARYGENIETNLANRAAQRVAIEGLPSKTARDAALHGVEIADLRALYSLPKEFKNTFRVLAEEMKRAASGEGGNIHEILGKPIVNRVRSVAEEAQRVRVKLGSEAKKIGVVTGPELRNSVIERMKKVPGMEDIKFADDGTLDFSNTVLQSARSQSAQNAIQQAFLDATQWAKGIRLHRLRQELFEDLKGKLKGGIVVTDTERGVINAIRGGILDALEHTSPGYRALSQRSAKLLSPLNKMERYLKAQSGLSEDLLQQKAGILARRLTGKAPTGVDLMGILKELDEVFAGIGAKKALPRTEALMKLFNTLDKYYKVSGTGFQEEITKGFTKAMPHGLKGITDIAVGQLEKYAGTTDAVKRQALERVLHELFR